MYENPQNVVLPEQTQMDKIIAATLYLLNTGSWEASVSLYTDVIQNACTPLDIIYTLAKPYRLCAVNFLSIP